MAKRKISIRISDEAVINKIYIFRGCRVMLDKDLAELYEVETKVFNQAVRRNARRFPSDFMFQLTEREFKSLRSQIVTSNRGGNRYLPNVFTEQGVAMLSSVLNSAKAIDINIQIIRVFSKIRQMLIDNSELRFAVEEIRKKTDNNSKNIELVFQYLDQFLEKKQKPRKLIGYKVKK